MFNILKEKIHKANFPNFFISKYAKLEFDISVGVNHINLDNPDFAYKCQKADTLLFTWNNEKYDIELLHGTIENNILAYVWRFRVSEDSKISLRMRIVPFIDFEEEHSGFFSEEGYEYIYLGNESIKFITAKEDDIALLNRCEKHLLIPASWESWLMSRNVSITNYTPHSMNVNFPTLPPGEIFQIHYFTSLTSCCDEFIDEQIDLLFQLSPDALLKKLGATKL
jgi:hypothetical protein